MSGKTLFCLVCILAVWGSAALATPEPGPAWYSSFDSALKVSKRTATPMLLDFQASWCPPCKAMEKEVWPDARVMALSEKFVCVSVDIDADHETASRYRIRSIPTIVVADPWGNPITRHEGYLSAVSVADMMKIIPEDFSELKDSYETLEKNGKDGRALYRVGEFYRKHNIVDLSNQYDKQALKSKEAEVDQELLENILLAIGLNDLRLKKYDDAKKCFERCLKDAPNGKQGDIVMLGIVTTSICQGRIADGEKAFESLKTKYPESAATQQAAENLRAAKGQQK